ncbi:hypothetical protein [Antarcticirhabdus aurantiaca]|uniref:hypothetical protein n=1 Tax=Antarcticirhabdus aurantiaca TaxID=2606717 RepID=UPI00131C0827|nr:hypothetical protein [Antarcticirhabdus aurantiaca]
MIGILPATLEVRPSNPGGPMARAVVADGSGTLIVDFAAGGITRRPVVAEAFAERLVLSWNAHLPMVAALLAAREAFLAIDTAGGGTTLASIEEALAIAGVDLSRRPRPEVTR